MEVTDKAFIKGAFAAAATAVVFGVTHSAAASGLLKGIRTASEETAKSHNPFQVSSPLSKEGNGENLDKAA